MRFSKPIIMVDHFFNLKSSTVLCYKDWYLRISIFQIIQHLSESFRINMLPIYVGLSCQKNINYFVTKTKNVKTYSRTLNIRNYNVLTSSPMVTLPIRSNLRENPSALKAPDPVLQADTKQSRMK